MTAFQIRDTQPTSYQVLKEQKVDPMWSADEDERRAAIIKRAAAGAKAALRFKRTATSS